MAGGNVISLPFGDDSVKSAVDLPGSDWSSVMSPGQAASGTAGSTGDGMGREYRSCTSAAVRFANPRCWMSMSAGVVGNGAVADTDIEGSSH